MNSQKKKKISFTFVLIFIGICAIKQFIVSVTKKAIDTDNTFKN